MTKEPEVGVMHFEVAGRGCKPKDIGGLLKMRVARKQIILKRERAEETQSSSRGSTALLTL